MAADDFVNVPGFEQITRWELERRGRECAAAQSGLRELAVVTGGLFLGDTSQKSGLQRVLSDTSGYYLLGYSPGAGETGERRLRRVEVRLKARGHRVRARRAYYG